MNIAIIPARGGSKRIPRKNIKEFHGKPMIAYSIETALESNCFDKVIVSTDDAEIAEVAIKYGAEVPFIRPANIADDYATTLDVVKHAVEFSKLQEWNVKNVCCIYATAPFLISEFIQRGFVELTCSNIDYAFSATSFPFPIQRALKLNGEQHVEMFHPEHFNTRSQDLEEGYHDAGQFYWGTVDAFVEKKVIFGSNSKMILLPRKYVQDIDTPEDWDFAEKLFMVMRSE